MEVHEIPNPAQDQRCMLGNRISNTEAKWSFTKLLTQPKISVACWGIEYLTQRRSGASRNLQPSARSALHAGEKNKKRKSPSQKHFKNFLSRKITYIGLFEAIKFLKLEFFNKTPSLKYKKI